MFVTGMSCPFSAAMRWGIRKCTVLSSRMAKLLKFISHYSQTMTTDTNWSAPLRVPRCLQRCECHIALRTGTTPSVSPSLVNGQVALYSNELNSAVKHNLPGLTKIWPSRSYYIVLREWRISLQLVRLSSGWNIACRWASCHAEPAPRFQRYWQDASRELKMCHIDMEEREVNMNGVPQELLFHSVVSPSWGMSVE